ncbi:CHAT domain-containing protein [Tolypothrix bouteillei VB521301_2]|uniref:CHAT domain-containing protein n=1 Tax=Tolypothrix bouteillei TaxID=1246981 RepID=UPI0005133075
MSGNLSPTRKILLLSANPSGISQLRLDEEMREIKEGLRRAHMRDRFSIDRAEAVRYRDIHRAILEYEPHIIHFSGHGSGEDGLLFEGEAGQQKLVDAEALAGLFQLFADQVECVVLNACYSKYQATGIAQHINYVVGMSQDIGDKAAIEFAIGFYDALGADKDYEFAYKLGCQLIRMAGIPEHLTPQLLKKTVSKIINFNANEVVNFSILGSNPFNYGSPVTPKRFYGRHRVIADVKNRIGAMTAQCINIVGLRRSGKTSLLRYIEERRETFFQQEQKPLLVKLDLQDIRFHTPEGIIEGLRRCIQRRIGVEPWARDANDDPYAVEDGLVELREQGYRLIVMLDEMERIGARLEQFHNWGEDWRAKASDGLFALVIAGTRPLSEVYSKLNLTSPFSNIFSTTILGALEEEAWQQLVQDGFALKTLDVKSLQWIDNLAGGLPYYIQMAAAMLWQFNNLEQAREEFIFQASSRFTELWHDLTERERYALRFASGVVGITAPTQAITNTLLRYGLLRTDGRLFSSAFAEFVRGQ